MSVTPDECARCLLDAVPVVMRDIRSEMRRSRARGMSISQFRALAFLSRHDGATPSDIADHVGLALPSVSRMLDLLVTRSWIARRVHPCDRRRVALSLTQKGKALLQSARAATQDALAERLAGISPSDLVKVAQAMDLLRRLFARTEDACSSSRKEM